MSHWPRAVSKLPCTEQLPKKFVLSHVSPTLLSRRYYTSWELQNPLLSFAASAKFEPHEESFTIGGKNRWNKEIQWNWPYFISSASLFIWNHLKGPNRHKNNTNNMNPDLSKLWISHLQQVPTALVIEDEWLHLSQLALFCFPGSLCPFFSFN